MTENNKDVISRGGDVEWRRDRTMRKSWELYCDGRRLDVVTQVKQGNGLQSWIKSSGGRFHSRLEAMKAAEMRQDFNLVRDSNIRRKQKREEERYSDEEIRGGWAGMPRIRKNGMSL